MVTAKVKATGAVLKCQVTVTTGSGNANSGNGNNNAGNTGNGDDSDNTGNNDNNNGDNTGGNTDNGGGNNDNNNGGGDNNGNTGDNGNTTPVDPEPVKEPYLAVYSETSGNMEPVSELNWNFGDETYTYIYLVNADDDNIVWNCTDSNVVNIYDMGNPTYVAVSNNLYGGKAAVTATCNGKTYTCNITSYLLRDHTRSMEEGIGFDYEELKEIMESAVTSAGTTEKVIDVQEPLEWSRTDLIKKNVTQDGSYTHYTVEGSGDTVITGMTEDGYTKAVLTITSTGKYIEKQGTYDEELTNEVYDLLKLEDTRNTDSTSARYSMPEDQLEFLLETADRWYNGEISERTYHNLAMYTEFENSTNTSNAYGDRIYSFSATCKTIVLSDVKTPEDIAKGINTAMGCEYNDPSQGWVWSRPLFYIKVHMSGNNVYVYMIP